MDKKQFEARKTEAARTTYKPTAFAKKHETANTYTLADGTVVSVSCRVFGVHLMLDENGEQMRDENGNPHVLVRGEMAVKTKQVKK
jgi:hypothetical protein